MRKVLAIIAFVFVGNPASAYTPEQNEKIDTIAEIFAIVSACPSLTINRSPILTTLAIFQIDQVTVMDEITRRAALTVQKFKDRPREATCMIGLMLFGADGNKWPHILNDPPR